MATFDEDDAQRLLRKFRECRAEVAERIINGSVSPDNVVGGYRHMTEMINAIDQCIEDVKEIFGS
jgi:hypothetical protein